MPLIVDFSHRPGAATLKRLGWQWGTPEGDEDEAQTRILRFVLLLSIPLYILANVAMLTSTECQRARAAKALPILVSSS